MEDTINQDSKKKNVVVVIKLIVVLGILIAGSFALWQATRKQTENNLIGSACVSIEYSNETGDISLSSAWPMTDNEGKATTPYSFTITNNCDIAVNYQVSLESIANPNNPSDNYINDNYIDVYLDNNDVRTFGSLINITNDTNANYTIRNTKKITTGKLFAHESKTHNLRLWLDEDTPDTEMNKGFYSKIKVMAGQGIELDCYAVNSEGVLTKYNPDCGMSATIPATVDNIPVRKIASNAFVSDYSYAYFMEDGVTEDDISFSLVVDGDKMNAYNDSDYATLSTATSDDAEFVIYKEKDKHIKDAIEYLKQNPDQLINNLYQLESISSLRINDINIHNLSNLISRPTGYEYFYKVTKSGSNYISTLIGYRISTQYTDTRFYNDINYLDLSKATNLTEIDDNAFSGLRMKNPPLEFPSSLRRIGKSAFEGTNCDIILNEGLEVIDSYAFCENSYMDNIDVPSSVTYIGELGLTGFVKTITVHTQALYDTRSSWAPSATVVYEP